MKDPAVLFYFQDFLVGTEFMEDAEVGKYIRVLCHLADKGVLTPKQLSFICRGDVPLSILSKLLTDDDGNFYQRRMREERKKRIDYSESRRKNRVKKDNKICESYDGHMENENINENINVNKKSKVFKAPDISEVIEYFIANGYCEAAAIKAHSYYSIADWHDSKGDKVKNWKQKMQAVWFKEENKAKPKFIMP